MRIVVIPDPKVRPMPTVLETLTWFPRFDAFAFCYTKSEPSGPPPWLCEFSRNHLVDVSITSSYAVDLLGLLAQAPLQSAVLDIYSRRPFSHGGFDEFDSHLLPQVQRHVKTLQRLTLTTYWPVDEDELEEISRLCRSHNICWRWHQRVIPESEVVDIYESSDSEESATDDDNHGSSNNNELSDYNGSSDSDRFRCSDGSSDISGSSDSDGFSDSDRFGRSDGSSVSAHDYY